LALVANDGVTDRYLRADDLARWGLPWDEALARACQSFDRQLAACDLDLALADDCSVARIDVAGPYAGMSLLVATFAARLERDLGAGFLACLPCRDRAIAFRARPREAARR